MAGYPKYVYDSQVGGLVERPENNRPFMGDELQEMKQRSEYCGQCKTSDCEHLIAGGTHYENPALNFSDQVSMPEYNGFTVEVEWEEPLSYEDPDNHPHRSKRTKKDLPRNPRPERP